MKKIAFLTLLFFIIILFQRFKNSSPESEVATNPQPSLKDLQANESTKSTKSKRIEQIILKKADIDSDFSQIESSSQSVDKPTPPVNQPAIIEKEGFVPMTNKGELIITSIALDGEKAITQGDILVGYKDDVMDINRQQKPILIPRPRLWVNGIVYYEIESNLPNRDQVQKSIDYFNNLGIVKFVEGYSDNYLYFKAGDNNCYSYVGMIGGEQEVSLSPGCQFRQINHELMHALGFFHEQSREDRDENITINWDNIAIEYHPQFLKITDTFTGVVNSKFDFNSLMLYPPNAFSEEPELLSMEKKTGGPYQVNLKGELSAEDLKRLKSLYDSEIKKRAN